MPQLKAWARKNERNVRISKKAELVQRGISVQSTRELERALDAEERSVTAAAATDCEILPPGKKSGWVDSPELFPVLTAAEVQPYLRCLDGYTKNWKSGYQLVEDRHVTRVMFHPDVEGLHFFKARCKSTVSSVPKYYELCALVSTNKSNKVDCTRSAKCTCKAGQSSSCKNRSSLSYIQLSE